MSHPPSLPSTSLPKPLRRTTHRHIASIFVVSQAVRPKWCDGLRCGLVGGAARLINVGQKVLRGTAVDAATTQWLLINERDCEKEPQR
ncbi:hypothetical protein E2C01_081786 [Portunus trituberculatus]|uniref:Uncharacterized protein n=1 Tax=Portunus trituberculatus TaxID=210409 RepID=A0A5B7IXJ5_PORTR|nr:hypothetical protein [Portunus trituberculatus]